MSTPTHYTISPLIDTLVKALQPIIKNIQEPYAMVGISSGGVWLAKTLQQKINPEMPLGFIDISFYRDDFTRIGMNPQVNPSHMPFVVENITIILVDDVLYTGRTIRAALNELFDYGRPHKVILAVLVERNGRELPISADIAALKLNLPSEQYIYIDKEQPEILEIKPKNQDA